MERIDFELNDSYGANLAKLSLLPPHEAPEVWLRLGKEDSRYLADIAFQGAVIERLLQGSYAALDYSEIQRQKLRDFVVEVLAALLSMRDEGVDRHKIFKLIAAVGNSIAFHEEFHGSPTLRKFAYERGLNDRWGGETTDRSELT